MPQHRGSAREQHVTSESFRCGAESQARSLRRKLAVVEAVEKGGREARPVFQLLAYVIGGSAGSSPRSS